MSLMFSFLRRVLDSLRAGLADKKHLLEELEARDRLLTRHLNRLAVTLRSIGDAVITTDTEGRVTMLNKVAQELTGWTPEDALGREMSEIFVILDERTREKRADPVAKVLETRKVLNLPSHTCLVAKGGRELSISDSVAPILDDAGNILGVVLVFRDMTEKLKLAETLHRVQNVESIGVLAGGIAHDFNNVLTGIFGNISLARSCAEEGKLAETHMILTRAMDVFARAKGLTQQLLTFSKGGVPVRTVQDLGILIRNSTQFALSGSSVSVAFGIAEDLWLCDCDGGQIGQVVDNIVLNAKQATPEGGRVDVRAGNRVMVPVPGDFDSPSGNFVEIIIQDSGVGMPQEILSKIFTPFFSTKSAGQGLGLAAAYSIVQRHDGWLEVESESGVGSTFHVFLPAAGESTIATSDDSCLLSDVAKGKGRILVMDDQEYILHLLIEMLEHLGYEPTSTRNGTEAVQAFRIAEEQDDPFVACILDLTIPGGMGGDAAAKEILAIRASALLVASSGYTDSPSVIEPTGSGFTASLVKPFLLEELASVLEGILAQKRLAALA
jgi:PAS domain S-box-containing protein